MHYTSLVATKKESLQIYLKALLIGYCNLLRADYLDFCEWILYCDDVTIIFNVVRWNISN